MDLEKLVLIVSVDRLVILVPEGRIKRQVVVMNIDNESDQVS